MNDAYVNFAASYIDNIVDAQYPSRNTYTKQYWFDSGNIDKPNALSLHADLSYKAFSMYADWVGVLRNVSGNSNSSYTGSSRFWGANVNGAYAFKTWERDSSLGAGFHWTGNCEFLLPVTGSSSPRNNLISILPKWRFVADYKINLFKNTDLDLIFAHGKSYDFTTGAASVKDCRSTTSGLARLMFQF